MCMVAVVSILFWRAGVYVGRVKSKGFGCVNKEEEKRRNEKKVFILILEMSNIVTVSLLSIGIEFEVLLFACVVVDC